MAWIAVALGAALVGRVWQVTFILSDSKPDSAAAPRPAFFCHSGNAGVFLNPAVALARI